MLIKDNINIMKIPERWMIISAVLVIAIEIISGLPLFIMWLIFYSFYPKMIYYKLLPKGTESLARIIPISNKEKYKECLKPWVITFALVFFFCSIMTILKGQIYLLKELSGQLLIFFLLYQGSLKFEVNKKGLLLYIILVLISGVCFLIGYEKLNDSMFSLLMLIGICFYLYSFKSFYNQLDFLE